MLSRLNSARVAHRGWHQSAPARATLRGGLLGRMTKAFNELGGLMMMIGSLTPNEQTTAIKEVFATSDVRTLIANHLGISVGRVTDEAHFTNDLGADWLGRLELMMAVEDQFAGVEITDEDVDQIAVCGRSNSSH